ncbi:MAG: hypothetical protein JRI68_07055 [Deltaproteobacteria bacterium]|nr:hypothetical protein [Deltaproteobacteria bacterium]
MSRVALAWPLCALALLVWGCDDQPDPENIPFEGVDVNAAGDPRKAADTTPTASASSTSKPKVKYRPGSGTAPKKPAGSITGCCAALSAAVKTAKDQGARAMYGQAAAVCYRKNKDVEAGKLEPAQAMSQVRSSLLDEAPAACR